MSDLVSLENEIVAVHLFANGERPDSAYDAFYM